MRHAVVDPPWEYPDIPLLCGLEDLPLGHSATGGLDFWINHPDNESLTCKNCQQIVIKAMSMRKE